MNSETSALHLALVLCGVGTGDEVILPAQTFIATGSVILMQKATPVFADIDPDTGNITADSIAHKVNSKTKAIIVVHHGGYPFDMNDIHYVAAKAAIPVIEDAAHALGAKYKGDVMGTLSRFACFSFQAIKHVTCGDGGALCCQFKTDYERARLLRWFGIDRRNTKASILGEREFDVKECGYKYHMNDLAAAVGIGNLSGFAESLKRRQQIGEALRLRLAGIAGIELMESAPDRTHAYWFFSLLVDRREDFIRKVAGAGVEASVVHFRIDKNDCFGGPYDLPGQAEFEARHVALPVHEGVTWEAIDVIVETLKAGW
jgi:perosamine synthetase